MWDSLPDRNFFSEFHAEGASGNGSVVSFFGYKWNSNHGSAIIFSYAYTRPAYARINGGGWSQLITL